MWNINRSLDTENNYFKHREEMMIVVYLSTKKDIYAIPMKTSLRINDVILTTTIINW